jgi:RNA polymerase sigma-70 factor (sigma-E family)
MVRPAEEFDEYVRARTPALIRSAYLLTSDQHRAEDLVQEALIRTYRAWSRLTGSNPDAYTRTVMYHLAVSRWRRKRPTEISTDRPPERGGPDETGRSDSRLALRAALDQLPPRQRAVIVLRYFEDTTEAETAQILGISIGTVKSTASRALTKLRAVAPYLLDMEGARGDR